MDDGAHYVAEPDDDRVVVVAHAACTPEDIWQALIDGPPSAYPRPPTTGQARIIRPGRIIGALLRVRAHRS